MKIPQEPFDAATANLRKGVNLVEASAGTGKTFAIAMLVLRFVTEFDVLLTNILVVTFTRAATEELKDRIRARLASARSLLVSKPSFKNNSYFFSFMTGIRGRKEMEKSTSYFLTAPKQQPETGKQNDEALAAWRAGLADRGITESLALQRLERALLDMDQAPVFTIHGFCQRMLQEQALESGQLFDFDLTTDLTSQRNQVVHDYWRRTVYPLSPLHCALITSDFKTPADLFKSVEGTEKRTARIEPQTGTIDEALTRFDHSLRLLADWWQAGADSLRARLEEALALDKFRKELQNNFPDWWRQVDDFLGGRTMQPPDNMDFLSSPGIMARLNGNKFKTSGGQSGEAKKQAFIATLHLPEQELADLRQARDTITLAFRLGLIRELSTGLARTLRRQNLLSFDDLIAQLAQSLTSQQGPELQRIIGERYPVALIDEFQDTDDAQYSIFSTLFASQGRLSVAGARDGTGATAGQGRRSHYLYLIGDPKQAIYTFRGADIYSYFKAREEADIHLNLARNYRSHPALVEAVNRLFQLREDAFATARLPYFPVLPAKSADDGQLLDNGQRLAAMVYCHLDADPDSRDGRWNSTRATERIVAYVAAETARLLQPQAMDGPVSRAPWTARERPQQAMDGPGSRAPAQAQPASHIMLTATDEPSRPLAARDIAILVRNHRQADQFQTALAQAGIPAVTASQQSVFHTDECHHLFLLMQALNSPGDATLLKTALTSPWFGMNGMELFTLWQNPEQVDQWLNRFHDYHQLWLERGFLAMMTRLLAEEMILLNLARQPWAERRISNIHHLLELIQTAATEAAMGPGKTLQWLQATKEETRSREDTELRLESDEEAVRIVTMHSAKGLEYPVAFCPFLWQRGNYIQTVKGRVICHDDEKALVMDLGSPDFEARREQALREELAEELRLAYVALTRARCRCYTFWAEVKGSGKNRDSRDSALAWLLVLEQDITFADRIPSLQATDGSAACELLAAGHDEPVAMIGREMDAENLAPLLFTGRNLHTDWLLHSYSSLAVAHQPDNQSRWSDKPDSPDLSQDGMVDLLPDLPKGAQMGNLVHGLLEQVPFATLAGGTGYDEILRQQCAWFGVDVSPGRLAALLQNVVQTPLPMADAGTPFCLADLEQAETIREMPFYFRLQATARDGLMPREPGMAGAASTTEQINAILAGSRTVTPITPKTLQGYLTGFVDLICRYQGKYYIMDYKSNWLGNHLQDYGPESLERAMRDHNYGLQYWLYTLVLHRYLQNCVEGYDYPTHFGGVMYLFVRGMEPSLPGSGVYFDLPDFTTLELLSHCLGRSCAIHGTRDTEPSLAGGHSRKGSENE